MPPMQSYKFSYAYAKKKFFLFYFQTKIDLATAKSFCSTKFCNRLTQKKGGVFFYLILKAVLLKCTLATFLSTPTRS